MLSQFSHQGQAIVPQLVVLLSTTKHGVEPALRPLSDGDFDKRPQLPGKEDSMITSNWCQSVDPLYCRDLSKSWKSA